MRIGRRECGHGGGEDEAEADASEDVEQVMGEEEDAAVSDESNEQQEIRGIRPAAAASRGRS